MSIKEEIQRLQALEAKIQLYELLRQHVGAAVDATDDFKEEVYRFIDARIAEINGNTVAPKATKNVQEEEPLHKTGKSEVVKVDPNAEPTDPLSFSLKYRHLAGKEVLFSTPDGHVKGVVKGCLVPHLVVVTALGYNVKIEPKSIIKEVC